MKKNRIVKFSWLGFSCICFFFTMMFSGCFCNSSCKEVCNPCESVNNTPSCPTLSGVELWERNCQHCHNYRNSNSFSDTQWEVIMCHMRNQARLTGQEADAILKFLQASN